MSKKQAGEPVPRVKQNFVNDHRRILRTRRTETPRQQLRHMARARDEHPDVTELTGFRRLIF